MISTAPPTPHDALFDPAQTAARLPYPLLVKELTRLLADTSVQVPPRLVLPLPGGGSLLVMPALDGHHQADYLHPGECGQQPRHHPGRCGGV